MQFQNYNPLVYRSFGASDPTSLLSTIGGQYGYEGPRKENVDPFYYTANGEGAGKYVVNGQVFRSQQDYNNLNNYLSGRASFLDEQSRTNSEAYREFAANPYVIQGNSPLKSAAQKAAEAAAAKAAASTQAQGGTSKVSGNVSSPITGQTGVGTPISGRPLPAATGLTEIPRNNDALMKELQKLLGNIPGLFNVEGITKGFQDRIATDESFGRQAASNAAAEFAARTRAEGGDASLAGLVRAQAMLPVLQHTGELSSQLADKQLQTRENKGKLTATVAEALANLRTNYLKGLIDYTGKIQDIQSSNQQATNRLSEQSREFDLSHNLDLSRLTLQQKQQAEEEKQNRLQAILASSQLADKKIDPRVQNFYSTYPGEERPIDPVRRGRNDTLEQLIAQLQSL